MAEPDRLRTMLAQAEAHIVPHVVAPGAEATRQALRRRVRRRTLTAVAAVLLAVAGLSFAALAGESLPPATTATPSAEPTEIATTTPTAHEPLVGAATPLPTACAPPIKSLTFDNRVGVEGSWAYFEVSFKIADDQTFCPGPKMIDAFVMTGVREGNHWRTATATLVNFFKPGTSAGWRLGWDEWCRDDQEIWVAVGFPSQTWPLNGSPMPLWSPGKSSGAIRIAKPPHDGCTQPSPSPSPSP